MDKVYMEKYSEIKEISSKTFSFWKDSKGWAPKDTVHILIDKRLDWLDKLTQTLEIWLEKDELSEGELILANVNLGALIEGWFKLFYCVYLEDYKEEYKKNPEGKRLIAPNKLTFQQLKNFSIGKIYEENDDVYKWVGKVQSKRNAVHAFNPRDIGNTQEFHSDIVCFLKFIELIDGRLPYPY